MTKLTLKQALVELKESKNKAQMLRRKLELDIEELREQCEHKKLSGWMDHQWAPGHSSGYQVQICEECEKTIHKKHHCRGCEKELIDDEVKPGDGKTRAWGIPCCEKCTNDPFAALRSL